jgi:hypothetical protein
MILPREILLRSRKRVDMKEPVVWPRPLGLVGRGVGGVDRRGENVR